ncbi:uncharacterized protein LTHEOB_5184 [Lasiodiplodia theobromae]|uniref:uncharacterized protein n=1 Tax=Lasiodiplodia theobromae TaxID=45133 RepID=UPI0015C2FEBD|nr:uncharacterized protein LTHEOB_5184 [Lasiodiplodia theobromae]KAF4545351.1 hypothetical protein LTHEOB_5184 [Lasiodiplodia theobromae]
MTEGRAPRNALLDLFGEKNQNLSALHKNEFGTLKPSKQGQKVYSKIDNAIQKYQKKASKAVPQHSNRALPKGISGDRYPSVVLDLWEILAFREDGMDLRRVDIFFAAIDDYEHTGDEEVKSQSAYITVQALCLVDPTMAFTGMNKEKTTPFENAAESGFPAIVNVMVAELLTSMEKDYPDEAERKEKARRVYISGHRSGSSKTAFHLAAEVLSYGVLELLLQDFPQLADMGSIMATMKGAGPNGKQKNQDAALNAFELILRHMNTTKDQAKDIWQEAVKTSSLKVVHHLLQETGSAGKERFATYENAKFVMQQGNKDMWEKFDQEDREKFLRKMPQGQQDLLHTAVESCKADIVEQIIKDFPDQVEIDIGSTDTPRYPIYVLGEVKKAGRSGDAYKKIRNVLLHAMIRSNTEEMGIREIRRMLRDSGVDADTICLHLSNIDTEEQRFIEYVQWLQDQDDTMGKVFKFESILKYANFPDLHNEMPRHEDVVASLKADHNEIKIVVDWLRRRGVTQILELSVPDRLFGPHSDTDVRDCVVGSAVRVLKWRKLDLYLGNLTDKDDLQELCLYSSGNPSVHEQWYRELPNFKNLKKLHVFVVVDVLSKRRVKEVKAELQERLDAINRQQGERWTKDCRDLEKELVNEKECRKVPVAEYHWVTDRKQRTYRNLSEITNDVVGPKLASFIGKYHAATRNRTSYTRTKVALIDSGVVLVSGKAKTKIQAQTAERKRETTQGKESMIEEVGGDETEAIIKSHSSANDLASRVVDGKSFVNTGDDEEQVWWHASEPHGTQMARLICSIDPCCKLHVVKVTETRNSGISANTVAEAIRWAISRDVDVICLSLVAYTNTQEMSEAILEASEKDIAILSSTADEGLVIKDNAANQKRIRNNRHVFSIAACDRYGNLLDRSQKEGYDYRFIGHNVHVGQVPFLKSPESISGSSVATAIAAGTASLIIACSRISKNNGKKCNKRCDLVTNIFQEMLEGREELKYVVLENLCEKGKKPENRDFHEMVDNSFPMLAKPK